MVGVGYYGSDDGDRLDRCHLEPGARLHAGLAGVRPLLREDVRRALPGRAGAPVRAGLRVEAGAGEAVAAAELEAAADDLRQLGERPVPRGCAAGLHPARVRGDGPRHAAHLPGADQAARAAGRDRGSAALGTEHLAGGQRGEQPVGGARRCAAIGARGGALPLLRAAAWAARPAELGGDPVGDRGGRERAAVGTAYSLTIRGTAIAILTLSMAHKMH